MDLQPNKKFRRCANRYKVEYRVRSFLCSDQFLYMVMVFAQSIYRESLGDN